MKKVLWVVSHELPIVSTVTNSKNAVVTGGWITALSNHIANNKKYELAICCPSQRPVQEKHN